MFRCTYGKGKERVSEAMKSNWAVVEASIAHTRVLIYMHGKHTSTRKIKVTQMGAIALCDMFGNICLARSQPDRSQTEPK